MDRDAFLGRVREAARSGRAYRVHVTEPPTWSGYVGAAGDLCESFAREVEAVGGQAHLVEHWSGVRDVLEAVTKERSVRSALLWQHPVLDRAAVRAWLAAKQVEAYDHASLASLPESVRHQRRMQADLGISSVDWAIAETGSLVLCSQPGQERVVSLLPPVHVAIVARDQIVPDVLDAFRQLDPQKLPSNVVLVTGPSKTGDIELQLTTGVHGPGQWHVVIVRSPQGRG